jgi:hypothetical protein
MLNVGDHVRINDHANPVAVQSMGPGGRALATTPVGLCPSASTPSGVLERTNRLAGRWFVRTVQVFAPLWTIQRCTQRFGRSDTPTLVTTSTDRARPRLGRGDPPTERLPNPRYLHGIQGVIVAQIRCPPLVLDRLHPAA